MTSYCESFRLSALIDAGIQTDGAESSEKPRMFNLNAAIHYHFEARFPCPGGGLSLITPSCIQITFAPRAMASSTISGTAAGSRKISTISMDRVRPAETRTRAFQYFVLARIHRGHVIAVAIM